MKNKTPLYIIPSIMFIVFILIYIFIICQYNAPVIVKSLEEDSTSSRRTVLTTTDGDIIRELDVQNIEVVSNIAKANIDTIESEVLVKSTTPGYEANFRNNNGILEFRNNGAQWKGIGTGDVIQDGGSGTSQASTTTATSPTFLSYSGLQSIVVKEGLKSLGTEFANTTTLPFIVPQDGIWNNGNARDSTLNINYLDNSFDDIRFTYYDGRGDENTLPLNRNNTGQWILETFDITRDAAQRPYVPFFSSKGIYFPSNTIDETDDVRDFSIYQIPFDSIINNIYHETDEKKFGSSSFYCSASNYSNIQQAIGLEDLSRGHDFVISLWIKTTQTGLGGLVGNASSANNGWAVFLNGGGLYVAGIDGADWNTGLTGLNDDAWHFIVVQRSGSSLEAWADSSYASTTITTGIEFLPTAGLYICQMAGGSAFQGYVDDILFEYGTRYSEPITVPTEPYYAQNVPYDYRLSDIYLFSEYNIQDSPLPVRDYSAKAKPLTLENIIHSESLSYGESSILFDTSTSDAYIAITGDDANNIIIDHSFSISYHAAIPEIGTYTIFSHRNDGGSGDEGPYIKTHKDLYDYYWEIGGFSSVDTATYWRPTDSNDLYYCENFPDLFVDSFHHIGIQWDESLQKILLWIDGDYFCERPDVTDWENPPTDSAFVIGGYENAGPGVADYIGVTNNIAIDDFLFVRDVLLWNSNIGFINYPQKPVMELSEQPYSSFYVTSNYSRTDYPIRDFSHENNDIINTSVTHDTTTVLFDSSSFAFNGSADLEVADNTLFNFTDKSWMISFWLKTSQDTGEYEIINGGNDGTSSDNWEIDMNDGRLRLHNIPTATGYLNYTAITEDVADDNWHYIVVSSAEKEDNSLAVYSWTDGIDRREIDIIDSITWNYNNKVFIGKSEDGTGSKFNGNLDDIFISTGKIPYGELNLSVPISTKTILEEAELTTGIRFNKEVSGGDIVFDSYTSTPFYINAITLTDNERHATLQYPIGSFDLMQKDEYDENFNSIVDKSESVNDDTYSSTAQEIRNHIDNSSIHSAGATAVYQNTLAYEWQVDGSIITGTKIDTLRGSDFDGYIRAFEVILGNTGTGGSDLVVDLILNSTSVYDGGGTKPTITANSGTNQVDISTNMNTTSISSTDILSIEIESVPTGAQNLRVIAYVALTESQPVIEMQEFTWKIIGVLITGNLDLSRNVPKNSKLLEFSCLLENTGTGGSNLVADLLLDTTSVYDGGGTKPTITANSGSNQSAISTDMSQILLLNNQLLEFELESVPTGSENLICQALYQNPIPQYQQYTFIVNGPLVTGTSIDISRFVRNKGFLISHSCVLEDTGTGGNDFVADLNLNGTSVYTGGGTQPLITANSGSDQRVISTNIINKELDISDILTLDIDTVPTGAENVSCQVIQQIIQ